MERRVRTWSPLLAWTIAACAGGGTAGPSWDGRPPASIAVAPGGLDLGPRRGLVLGAGGVGRAVPVALAPTPWRLRLAVDAPGARAGVAWLEAAVSSGAASPRTPPPWVGPLARAALVAQQVIAVRAPAVPVAWPEAAAGAPPAAATLAVASLCGLTGRRLDPATAVVAELETDGTLAPPADVDGEVIRAARRGARHLVLPATDLRVRRGGRTVDVAALAGRRGIAVSRAPDLAAAFGAVCGPPLPQVEPAPPDHLALDAGERAALAAAYARHLARLAIVWPRLVARATRARLAAPSRALIEGAMTLARRAEQARVRGDLEAAHLLIGRAATAADAATRLDEVLRETGAADVTRARAALARGVAPSVAAGAASPPPTARILDGLRQLGLTAHRAAEQAWRAEASSRLAAATAEIDALVAAAGSPGAEPRIDDVASALVAAARAHEQVELATDRRALDRGGGITVTADAGALAMLARVHHDAATHRLATPAGGHPRRPDLVLAVRLLAAEGSPGRAPLEQLAAAATAHALLRRDATSSPYAAQVDRWSGRVLRVGRSDRLAEALRLAGRAARQRASAARTAIGVVPFAARLAYQAAAGLERGPPSDRLVALEAYRAASDECALAVSLAIGAPRRAGASAPAGVRRRVRPERR